MSCISHISITCRGAGPNRKLTERSTEYWGDASTIHVTLLWSPDRAHGSAPQANDSIPAIHRP